MTFQEKSTWVTGAILLAVYGWYFATVFGRIGTGDINAPGYRGLMFVTVLSLVILSVIAHVVIAVANPRDAGRTDVRDREINRYGEYVGGFVLGFGAMVALAMTLFEVDHFWIANVILAGLVLSELVAIGTRIVLYRRGF